MSSEAATDLPKIEFSQYFARIPLAFQDLFNETFRDYAFFGGRGGGKSHAVAGALVIQAAMKPLRIVCAREVQSSLRDSVQSLVEDKIADFGLGKHFECLRDETRGRNGSLFLYKGLSRNPDAIKSLEGADIFWGEEANRLSARSLKLVRPTLRKPGARMIWTWNPEFDHDPVDRLFRGPAGPPPKSLVRQVGWENNPYFEDTPLPAEMAHDYRIDAGRAGHVWGGAYAQTIEGAYYATPLAKVYAEGRVTVLARDPILRVRAFWDLGRRDATAIWLAQFVGREVRVLDYIEGRGQGLDFYIGELRRRGWGEALCELPHDGRTLTLIAKGSAEEQLRAAGFEVHVTPNQGAGAAMLRVEAARRLFPQIWFNDTAAVAAGMKALAAYHERRDEGRNVGLGPEHDWASDPADAFGLMCVAYETPREKRPRARRETFAGPGGWMG